MTARAGEATPSGPPVIIRESLQGKYSGFASRFAAFAVDVGVSLGVFMLALAAVSFAARVLTGKDIAWKGRHLGGHRLCGLGVPLLRPFLGRERQDRRH